MVMVSLLYRMVAESATAEVGLGNKPEFFQQFQSAVYGGDVYLGVFGMDLFVYFICTDMMVTAVDCGKYHAALRRQPVALFS